MSLQPIILSASNSMSLLLLVVSSFRVLSTDGDPSGPTGGRRSESGC